MMNQFLFLRTHLGDKIENGRDLEPETAILYPETSPLNRFSHLGGYHPVGHGKTRVKVGRHASRAGRYRYSGVVVALVPPQMSYGVVQTCGIKN